MYKRQALVRAYVKDNFVDKGMCADFAIHDKGTGNPHVHIMLTLRPLKENGPVSYTHLGNDRDLTVTETGEIQQRCRELLEKCREP